MAWSVLTNGSFRIDLHDDNFADDLVSKSSSSRGSFQVYASCRAVDHLDVGEMSGLAPATKELASALLHS